MKFLILVAILAISQIHAQQIDTSSMTSTERKAWADNADNQTAFSSTQLKQQIAQCYADFVPTKTLTTSQFYGLSASDKTLVLDTIGKYQYCTQGSEASPNQSETAQVAPQNQQLGRCKYLWNDIDGADQNELYFAAKKCFQESYTSFEADQGYDSTEINSDCYRYYTSPSDFTGSADLENVVKTVFDCIEDAVFYTRPYTERQFFNCQQTCQSNAAAGVLDSNFVVQDAAFNTCVSESAECARFQILNSSDATDPDYATNYKACYHNQCHKASGISADTQTYFTCIEACTMPDYSIEQTDSSNLLKSSLLAIVVLFAIMF